MSTPALPPGPTGQAPTLSSGQRLRNKLFHRTRLWAMLYLLMLPTMMGVLVFTYLPNVQSVKYAFYNWDGGLVEEFVGIRNFLYAFRDDPLFWQCFGLVGILLLANLLKMWPTIFVAIAMHRLRSTGAQYLYRILFVIPMVIPGMVWLLLWKTFYTEGMLNDVLNVTGLMTVLNGLDSPTSGLPALAGVFQESAYRWNPDAPLLSALLQPFQVLRAAFASSWGLALFGVALLVGSTGLAGVARRWPFWAAVAASGWFVWGVGDLGPLRWAALLAAAALIPEWLLRRDRIMAPVRVRWMSIASIALASLLVLLTEVWTTSLGVFAEGSPAWLSHSKLVIPALILWGFPWVGTIGVLLYLAGLQAISQEVYEAADLDGVSSFSKIFRIELPLILTQVRINLIFMTIGTLTDFGLILIVLGPQGGPDNVAMVPGLYMYQKAFLQGVFGYACTLGMILFLITLVLTYVYQRYVKVEK